MSSAERQDDDNGDDDDADDCCDIQWIVRHYISPRSSHSLHVESSDVSKDKDKD